MTVCVCVGIQASVDAPLEVKYLAPEQNLFISYVYNIHTRARERAQQMHVYVHVSKASTSARKRTWR